METIKLFERRAQLDWEYDGEADVLYLSFGGPREAEGIDIDDGVIVRYSEAEKELVGLTILGIRDRMERLLKGKSETNDATSQSG